MASSRLAKVNAVIAAELGGALERAWNGEDVMVTVTRVETTPDLREARCWISLLPERDDAWPKVLELQPELQAHLASRLTMKFVPRLALKRDEGAAHAQKIDSLLRHHQ